MADFNNITNGKVDWSGLGREIRSFVLADPDSEYKLIIGSDSRSRDLITGRPGIDLVTAVVIHRKGRGGRYFWKKTKVENVYSLKEKLYQETLASLKAAHKLLDLLKSELNGQFETLEIHIDVGEKGPSREVIKELVGMVTGNGFDARTKPGAFAAASVADKYT